jgi:hypothetical protein
VKPFEIPMTKLSVLLLFAETKAFLTPDGYAGKWNPVPIAVPFTATFIGSKNKVCWREPRIPDVAV